jgi:hypothetical protein
MRGSSEDTGTETNNRFSLPSIEEQAVLAQKHQVDVLLFCPDPWALRHRFVNQETGEVVRARCNSWQCLYCGPRKVDQWRQLVKAAEPTLFVTLTKVGWTIHEASRVYTTVLQYLRRGSKGFGHDHLGARLAYPLECFAVLEEHRDFEHVGFHWHLLVKGVDYIPKQTVSDALRSATNGRSYIVHVDGVKKMHAVGYVTKYLTKEVTSERRGMREELREMIVHRLDEQGNVVQECTVQTVQVMSRARRIRYTRRFFPASTAELRLRLFSQLCDASEIAIDQAASPGVEEVVSVEGDDRSGETEHEGKRSAWMLYEHEPFSADIRDYRARRQRALVESLSDLQAGKSMYSRRVVSIWAYQRQLIGSQRRYGKPLEGKEQG